MHLSAQNSLAIKEIHGSIQRARKLAARRGGRERIGRGKGSALSCEWNKLSVCGCECVGVEGCGCIIPNPLILAFYQLLHLR